MSEQVMPTAEEQEILDEKFWNVMREIDSKMSLLHQRPVEEFVAGKEQIMCEGFLYVGSLIAQGWDCNSKKNPDNGMTAFSHMFLAFPPGYGKQLVELCPGADVSRPCNKSGHTPLHIAIASHNAELLQLLIDRGANTLVKICDIQSFHGGAIIIHYTESLLYRCVKEKWLEGLQILLEARIPVFEDNAGVNEGLISKSPIELCAELGWKEGLAKLLNYTPLGPNVLITNNQDISGLALIANNYSEDDFKINTDLPGEHIDQ